MNYDRIETDALPRVCRAPDCVADPQPDSLYCARHARARTAQWFDHRLRQKRSAELRFQRRVAPNLRTNLYAIADGAVIKFGMAAKPPARLKDLQVSHARELNLLGWAACDRQLERDVHEFCREHRVRGEWFRREGRAVIVERLVVRGDTPGLYALIGRELPAALF